MFDNLPTDVPAEYLSGLAKFAASDGESTEGMNKADYIYALNQAAGLERVEADGEDDGRARQKTVEASEADEPIDPEEYTSSATNDELREWARYVVQNVE